MQINLVNPETYDLMTCLNAWKSMACAGINSFTPEEFDPTGFVSAMKAPLSSPLVLVTALLWHTQLSADRKKMMLQRTVAETIARPVEHCTPIDFCADSAGLVYQLLYVNWQNDQKDGEFAVHIVVSHDECLQLTLDFNNDKIFSETAISYITNEVHTGHDQLVDYVKLGLIETESPPTESPPTDDKNKNPKQPPYLTLAAQPPIQKLIAAISQTRL